MMNIKKSVFTLIKTYIKEERGNKLGRGSLRYFNKSFTIKRNTGTSLIVHIRTCVMTKTEREIHFLPYYSKLDCKKITVCFSD